MHFVKCHYGLQVSLGNVKFKLKVPHLISIDETDISRQTHVLTIVPEFSFHKDYDIVLVNQCLHIL